MIKIRENYYNAPSNVLSWAGVCTTNINKIYLISGSDTSGSGLLYKGPIEFNNTSNFYQVNYPNALRTAVYGPEFIESDPNCFDDYITIVGSYTPFEDITKINAFYFKGRLSQLGNQELYKTIKPLKENKITIAHSTKNGLAVYELGDVSPAEFAVGNSAIYDLDKDINIAEILYPGSFSTTAYGIWFNGIVNGYELYTIAGGYRNKNEKRNYSYIVDFYYNKISGENYFLNWSTIRVYDEFNLESHIQGISGLNNEKYVCACVNFATDNNNNTFFNSMTLIIKRMGDKFVLENYVLFEFPSSNFTSNNSVAENVCVGIYINSDGTFPFQANFTNQL